MCKFICKYVQSHLRACSVNCRCGDATKVPYCTICPGTLICKLQIVSQNEATLQGAVSREYAKQDEIRPQNFGSMSCRDAMMPRHQFTHVCVLTFGACEAQTSLTIMFEFEQIFRSCCTCPWHTYIYIYILLLGPVCHLFSQDYARSWSVAWGGPRDLDGWQRQWYAVGVFFCEVYIGLEPLVWKVQEAFIIYIYIYIFCVFDESLISKCFYILIWSFDYMYVFAYVGIIQSVSIVAFIQSFIFGIYSYIHAGKCACPCFCTKSNV